MKAPLFIKPEPKKSLLGLDRLAEKKRIEDEQIKKFDEDPGHEHNKEERLVKSGMINCAISIRYTRVLIFNVQNVVRRTTDHTEQKHLLIPEV